MKKIYTIKPFVGGQKKTGLDANGQPLNRQFNAKRRIDRDIDELLGVCKGCVADGILSPEEAIFIHDWLHSNHEVCNVWPGKILFARIEEMLSDQVIDERERQELFGILQEITGGKTIQEKVYNMASALPLDKPMPEVIFKDRSFCLTGKFIFGPRDRCEEDIVARGGKPQSGITQNLNYLIIGAFGSADWVHTTYGRKIEAVIELKHKGIPIAVVSEEHWTLHL